MGDYHATVKGDAVPRSTQPGPQFNVFDRRALVAAGIKTSPGQEELTPYRPAADPEAVYGAVVLMVHVMVEQVFVLRQKIRGRRGIVVGPDNGIEGWVSGKCRGNTFQGIGMDAHIGIDEHQVMPGHLGSSM